MRYLIVRTDVRAVASEELAAAWADGHPVRDEQVAPEPRRQVIYADDLDAAMVIARALASVGAVRSGRQRVKVVRLHEPPHPFRADPAPSGVERGVRRDRAGNAGPPYRPARMANALPNSDIDVPRPRPHRPPTAWTPPAKHRNIRPLAPAARSAQTTVTDRFGSPRQAPTMP